MNEPGETGQIQTGPGVGNALRGCLVSGLILVDGETQLATLTTEARQILGVPAQSGSETALTALPAGIAAVARESLSSGEPARARPINIPSPNGSTVLQVSAVPLKRPAGGPWVVLALHALSSASKFEQQIRQLDRLANVGTLAAGMAHEIKNALVASRTFIDLLLEQNQDSDLVQVVRRETDRIDAIVSRMLRFAGTVMPVCNPLHLHEVLEHSLRLVQPQVTSKSISLERSFLAAPDMVKGDEYELEQAFVNLLLNALEAMGSQGKLTLGTETMRKGPGGQRLRVVIQDTGGGILPEHMRHVFEPFFTTKPTGTGLGLAITQRIIQEHNGTISVESRAGQGTSFTILLPGSVEPAGMQLGNARAGMLGTGRG